MLNKELLLSSAENVGIVSVSMAAREKFVAGERCYLYKFTGDNWQMRPEDTIYAEFTEKDQYTTKIVTIPIGTVVFIDSLYLVTYFGTTEGFEGVPGPYGCPLKLVSKTAKVELSGHYC